VLPFIKPEPFGRVAVEAMTLGCAVIATNPGRSCELIRAGEIGLLVPPSDPKSLAEAIELVLADHSLREKIGKAAAVYAREHFGLRGHSAQIINELASTRKPELLVPDSVPRSVPDPRPHPR